MVEAEPEPNEHAEVVGDQPDPPKPERVEQREHVGENIAHGVPVDRRIRPTSAAQVRRDHSVALGEPGDDLAPLPPVLREAVQEQNRRGIRVPGLGDVHPQAGRERDELMRNTWELRHLGRLRAARRGGPAGRVRSIGHDTLVLHPHRQFTTRYLRRGPLVIMDRLAERRCVSRSACGTLSRLVASESMSQSGLLDSEGPGPVIALPQPAWADAYVHDVGIMGAFHFVRVLGEVGLQTPIGVAARWNVGGPLTLDLSLSQPIPSGTQVKG